MIFDNTKSRIKKNKQNKNRITNDIVFLKWCTYLLISNLSRTEKQWVYDTKLKQPQACNFNKKRLWYSCFPVNFANLLRTPFLQNTSRRLLLTIREGTVLRLAKKMSSRWIFQSKKKKSWVLLNKNNITVIITVMIII